MNLKFKKDYLNIGILILIISISFLYEKLLNTIFLKDFIFQEKIK